MGTQQTALTTVLMMGRWIVNVILGIVYGIKANRGAWGPTPPSANGSFPKKHPDGDLPVTTIRCSSRNASDTIIRLL
jgi:hypothetical protein